MARTRTWMHYNTGSDGAAVDATLGVLLDCHLEFEGADRGGRNRPHRVQPRLQHLQGVFDQGVVVHPEGQGKGGGRTAPWLAELARAHERPPQLQQGCRSQAVPLVPPHPLRAGSTPN